MLIGPPPKFHGTRDILRTVPSPGTPSRGITYRPYRAKIKKRIGTGSLDTPTHGVPTRIGFSRSRFRRVSDRAGVATGKMLGHR